MPRLLRSALTWASGVMAAVPKDLVDLIKFVALIVVVAVVLLLFLTPDNGPEADAGWPEREPYNLR